MRSLLNDDEIVALIKSHGLQVTASRLAIFRFALAPNKHFTVDDVVESLDKQGVSSSLATVYNTLNLLVEKNEIKQIVTAESKKVIYDSTLEDHFHIYDLDTGEIKDFEFDGLKEKISLPSKYVLESLDMLLKVRSK